MNTVFAPLYARFGEIVSYHEIEDRVTAFRIFANTENDQRNFVLTIGIYKPNANLLDPKRVFDQFQMLPAFLQMIAGGVTSDGNFVWMSLATLYDQPPADVKTVLSDAANVADGMLTLIPLYDSLKIFLKGDDINLKVQWARDGADALELVEGEGYDGAVYLADEGTWIVLCPQEKARETIATLLIRQKLMVQPFGPWLQVKGDKERIALAFGLPLD